MLTVGEITTLHNDLRSDIKKLILAFNKESGMSIDNIHLSYWRELGKPAYLKAVQTKLTLPNYNDTSNSIN